MSTEPAWVQHVMWWHVYPLGFVDAPIHPGPGARTEDDPQVSHRLDRIIGLSLIHILQVLLIFFCPVRRGPSTTGRASVGRAGSAVLLIVLVLLVSPAVERLTCVPCV